MSEDNENEVKKTGPVRSARGGSSQRKRSARQKPQGGGPNKAVLAVVLTVVVIGVAAFAMGAFDGEKKEDDTQKAAPVVEKETPKKKSNSIFDSSGSGDSNGGPKKRERVTGRAPKTIDIEKEVEHLGRLYMPEDLTKKVLALQKSVEEFKRERWDISKELIAEHKKLKIALSTAASHKFLSGAEDDLRSFNTFTRRREVHLKDKAGNLLPEPFIGVAHKPFVFMVQASTEGGEKKIADEVFDWMVQLKAEFVRYFEGSGIELKPKEESRIRIILFREYKDYANYNRIKNPERDISFALAHYEPDTRRLCVPLDFGALGGGKDKKHAFREVMFHEGTHQVMHYFTNTSHLGSWGSMWSDEGVAEYFAGHCIDPDDGKIKFGRINTRIAAVARDQKNPKFRITMTELLTWTRFKMSRERDRGPEKERIAQRIHSHVYSQGWAMVYFFNNYKNGIYKPKFMQIMKKQIGKSGDSGLPVWRQIFTDEEFDRIEVEYFDYLDFLTDAYNNKKIVNHTLVTE